jgi:putative inorganic carbon (hco3(-)) transporter
MIPAFTRASNPPTIVAPSAAAERDVGNAATSGESRVLANLSLLTDRLSLYLLYSAIAALFVRPADLFIALDDAPIYETLIVACLIVSLTKVRRVLSLGAMRTNAIAVLAFLLVPAVLLSHLSHANTYDARLGGYEMAKAFLMFPLVVGLIDTPAKWRGVIAVAAGSALFVAALALLHYHHLVDIPTLTSVQQRFAEANHEGTLLRLQGVGLFNDPNDLAMILVFSLIVCAYAAGERQAGHWRWLLLVPIAVFAYSLYLTHSRGALMSTIAALAVFLHAKVGWKSTLPLIALVLPVLLFVVSKRQTSINLDDPSDTFQARLGLWSDALEAFRNSPLFGIGQGKLVDEIGLVAHNSYLHAFAEMGVVGGVAFLGAFYFSMRGTWRAKAEDANLRRLRPYLLAIVVAYAVGLLSLSRCYTVPTQFILAISAAFLLMASRNGRLALPAWGWPTVGRALVVSACFLGATHVFVRLMISRGAD